jgi:hypothetical protein
VTPFLDQAGLLDLLTQFLVTLYEEQEKPSDAVAYMRKSLASGKNTRSKNGNYSHQPYMVQIPTLKSCTS